MAQAPKAPVFLVGAFSSCDQGELRAIKQIMSPDPAPSDQDVNVSGDVKNILIVDDEEVIRNVLAQRLRMLPDIEVRLAGDGEEALERLREAPADIVFSDIKMPRRDGLSLLRQVKNEWPNTAVLMMSGHADMGDTIEALRNGAVDFLQKPFDLSKAVNAVERVLRIRRVEYTDKIALDFLEEEARVFVLPNRLDICPTIASEVTRTIAERGVADASFLESIRLALAEMLINAIEHGNLGVSFEEKGEMIEQGVDYQEFLRARSEEEMYRDRRVRLDYFLDAEHVRFDVEDEGNGFDHASQPDPTDPENLLTPHGRGILITRLYMDELTYNEAGNKVTLIKRRKSDG